jgi:hypothetical protein
MHRLVVIELRAGDASVSLVPMVTIALPPRRENRDRSGSVEIEPRDSSSRARLSGPPST